MKKLFAMMMMCFVAMAANATKTVYLNPGAWAADNARFALYQFNSDEDNAWTDFVAEGDLLKAEMGDYAKMIICRMNPGAAENNWDNKWNQSGDLLAPVLDNQVYTFVGNVADGVTLDNGITSANKRYLRNKVAKKFWGAGNTWGTQASLVDEYQYVILAQKPDGKYTMESMVSNGGQNYYFGGDYMDSGATEVSIEASEGYYKFFIEEGKYFGYDGTSTVLGKGLAGDSENALWEAMDEAAVEAEQKAIVAERAAAATAENPTDLTILIKDANFGRNRRDAYNVWTIEASNKNLAGGGDNGNGCAESYHSTFNLYQILQGAPAGVYSMTAQGFYRQDGTDNDNLPVFFFGTEGKATFPVKTGSENSMADAGASFAKGLYTIDPIFIQVDEAGAATLTVGAKLETNTDLWCIWDNFQLKYYGNETTVEEAKLGAIVKEVAALRAEAQELLATAEKENVQTALQAALDATKTIETTEEAYEAAKATLSEAIALAKAYANAKVALAEMKKVTEETNVYTAEALNEYYGQWITKYDAGTMTTAEANALQNPAVVTGWRANTTVDNFLLSAWDTNPDFNNAAYYINTWSTEGDNDGSNFHVPFFEYWTGDANSLGEKTMTATMNVPTGMYKVTALVRVRVKNNNADAAHGIKLQVTDGEAVDVCTGTKVGTSQFYLAEFNATGAAGEDGKLYIKFKVAADNNISWLSFKNVKFERTDDAPTFTYTLVGGTGTTDGGKDDPIFGKSWEILEANNFTAPVNGVYSMTFNQIALVPGTKLLYKVVRNGSWDMNWGFNGGNADYVVNLPEGQTLPEGVEGGNGKFNITFKFNPTTSFANTFNVDCEAEYDEVATAITNVNTVDNSAAIYNLNGQRVQKAGKGLYIKNGKKVLVK